MHIALIPSPVDVLTQRVAEGEWARGLNVLLIQDSSDVVARPQETEQVAAQLWKSAADLKFDKTEKLGHIKSVGDPQVLGLVQRFIG